MQTKDDAKEDDTDRGGRAHATARATRRQKLSSSSLSDIDTVVPDALQQAATDRRGGWRASKAKGHRRNRRYEKRLLQDLGGVCLHGDDE